MKTRRVDLSCSCYFNGYEVSLELSLNFVFVWRIHNFYKTRKANVGFARATMRILRKQKSTYAISVILLILGIAALLATIWKTWSQVSTASNPISTFMGLLWTEKINVISGFDFALAYLFALGDVMLISGIILYVLSVQSMYLPGKTVWYRCPFCHKDWKATGDKALVHCPHCRQLVHPTIVEK